MRKLLIFVVLLVTACSPVLSGTARTPLPTLIPATLPSPKILPLPISYGTGECKIAALDLIGAWVKSGKSLEKTFPFSSINNKPCEGTFSTDIQPLFSQPNIWYAGAIACVTCHGDDVTKSPAGLSLVDYQNILSGSRRKEPSSQGNDILGDENTWEKSKLYIQIFTRQMPVGRPPTSSEKGPILNIGTFNP
jgi:hypothetical protein